MKKLEPADLKKLLSSNLTLLIDKAAKRRSDPDWEDVKKTIHVLKQKSQKAELDYCIFLHGVETFRPEWKTDLDRKEQTGNLEKDFNHWLRKYELYEDPNRYRAVLKSIALLGRDKVEDLGPAAVIPVIKNLKPPSYREAVRKLQDKRDDSGEPLLQKVGQGVVVSVKRASLSRKEDLYQPKPRPKPVERLRHKVEEQRVRTKTAEEENRELKAKMAELERENARLTAENARLTAEITGLRERLGAAQKALIARKGPKGASRAAAAPAE